MNCDDLSVLSSVTYAEDLITAIMYICLMRYSISTVELYFIYRAVYETNFRPRDLQTYDNSQATQGNDSSKLLECFP